MFDSNLVQSFTFLFVFFLAIDFLCCTVPVSWVAQVKSSITGGKPTRIYVYINTAVLNQIFQVSES